MIDQRVLESGLLVFAGAGISMIRPSSLPNWYQFNEVVLQALADEVSSYTKPQLGEWIFSGLVERRNRTPHFAPDYMADIIAEEVGLDYFKVVQSLDTDQINACHEALARLSGDGLVRAVVTTNFDRLLERAFERAGVRHRVYATPAQFIELRDHLSGSGVRSTPSEVPIIKVHGTVDDLESMVDTMSQRLVGRPQELEEALALLYPRHHLLFLGFSGADLDYDPEYLGLRAAAVDHRGFTFLLRTGDRVRASVDELRAAWGNGAAIIEEELPRFITDLAGGVSHTASAVAEVAIDRLGEVRSRAAAWARSLGRLQNVNVLSSLLRASGDDQTAGRLFWGIWKHYRLPEDCDGPTYGRFNHLLGRLLLEYGFNLASLRPPTSFGFTIGDAPFDKDEMDNAFQYLARAAKLGQGRAVPDLAACFALLGNCARAVEILEEFIDGAVKQEHRYAFVDGALSGGLVWSIAGIWSPGLSRLEKAREVAIRLGAEPRRARLDAHLVRFLAWKERYADAEARYEEGQRIAKRLGLEATAWELETAWGYALCGMGRALEAVPLLSSACSYFEQTNRLALQTRAALDLYYAAMLAGDQKAFDRAGTLLEEVERGYQPHVYSLQTEAGLQFDDLDYAQRSLEALKVAAEECRNDWAKLVAEAFEAELAKRASSPPASD